MKPKKIKIEFTGPLLPGSISMAYAKCGKPRCVCKGKNPILHGPYYRWTGFIDGRRTTRTITKEQAEECERRIENLRRLEAELKKLLDQAISEAPWID